MIRFSFNITKGSFNLDVKEELSSHGVTALFGPSGCGKTTLLRAVSGLEKTTDGSVTVDEAIWQNKDQFLPVHQRRVGFVFQNSKLFSHLTVKENLQYGLTRSRKKSDHLKLDDVVNLLGLESHLLKHPSQLSGGEKQRVAVGRAFLVNPSLLLMDEPLTGLDKKSKGDILPYLEKTVRTLKIPVLYVSHDIDEVARLADHVLLMEKGKIIARGPICEIFSNPELPPALMADAESIIETFVDEHDENYNLTKLSFPGGDFYVSRVQKKQGDKVRLRILSKGVSLVLNKPAGTSILNILEVTVKEIKEFDSSKVNIELDAGGVPLLCRITKKSADNLGILQGQTLFAQIKSVELLV